MGMTMTQKILAAHAGLPEVKPGELIEAKLDIVLGNDITTPVAINEFKKAGFDQVFDKDRVAIVLDHFVPNKDIKAAQQSKQCREFACSHCVSHFYDVGKMGIEHALLPEKEAMEWLQGGSCSQDVQISREVDYFLSYYRNLAPVVFLSYEREAFFSEERIYKTSFSKYGTAYQSMIYPGLVQPVYAKATEPGTVREAVCYG